MMKSAVKVRGLNVSIVTGEGDVVFSGGVVVGKGILYITIFDGNKFEVGKALTLEESEAIKDVDPIVSIVFTKKDSLGSLIRSLQNCYDKMEDGKEKDEFNLVV